MFEPLFYHDTRNGDLIPALAESYELLGPTRYQFNLRQGVKWHDGETFTAEDVAWTLVRTPGRIAEYLLDPENPVEIVDDYTIIVNTDGEVGPFIYQTVALNWRMLPEHILEPYFAPYREMSDEELLEVLEGIGKEPAEGETPLDRVLFELDKGTDLLKEVVDDAGNPVYIGTGPFKFENWERGVQITMVANDDYWGGRPNIDRLVWRWIEEDATRVIELESGGFDLIIGVPEEEIERLQDDPNIEVIASPGLNYRIVTLNLRTPALADVKVRQAIAHALNVEELQLLFPEGMTVRTCGPLPVSSPFYNDTVPCYEYDPDLSRTLLEEAGWDPNTVIKFKLTSNDLLEAQLIQAFLADVGITVELETVESATYSADVRQGRSEMAMFTFGNVVDPDHMFWVFHGDWLGAGKVTGTNGIFGYDDPDVNAWTVEGQTTADPDARRALYDQAQVKIVEDIPAIFLYSNSETTAYRTDRLTGIQAMPRPTDVFYWLGTADVIQ
ncbi:MAG: ABC transporter substrate-binding protein [Anaerolineae bacterium]|nr:ABC transporter substrate-binding protein [Anaerolineae bacterium]